MYALTTLVSIIVLPEEIKQRVINRLCLAGSAFAHIAVGYNS